MEEGNNGEDIFLEGYSKDIVQMFFIGCYFTLQVSSCRDLSAPRNVVVKMDDQINRCVLLGVAQGETIT